MTAYRIQLDVAPNDRRGEVGSVQRRRSRCGSLVDHPDVASGWGLLDAARDGDDTWRLTARGVEGERWLVSAEGERWLAALEVGVKTGGSLFEVTALRTDRSSVGFRVGAIGRLRPRWVHAWLAAQPLETARRRPRVELVVEPDAGTAIDAFDRGELDMTCPTAFDVAERALGRAELVPCRPDVQLYALVNPTRLPWLASRGTRSAIHARVSAAPPPSPLLAPLPMAGAVADPLEIHGGRVEVLYADHHPNDLVAARIASALAGLGISATIEPASFAVVLDRTAAGDYDVAVNLYCGPLAPGESVAMRSAALLSPVRRLRPAIAEALADGDDAVCALADALLPLVPLYEVSGGYLARGAEPSPLINGAYPVERLEVPWTH